MTSIEVSQWRQEGRVCLWRYRPMLKMYAGWHFTADGPGCDSLLKLLGLLAQSDHQQHRTLKAADPRPFGADAIFGPHSLKVWHPEALRLGVDPAASAAPGLVEDGARVEWLLDAEDIETLSEAIADVRRGEADFAAGFGEERKDPMERVNFWWWPARAGR